MSQQHVQDHIELIARHEQEFLDKRTSTEKSTDSIAAFVGSLPFVVVHLTIFASWMLLNTAAFGGLRPFDPPPFSLLGTIVALEAILVSSLILMRQTRMAKRADERDHLMLQILLLTEKELTAVLSMTREIAGKVGLPKVVDDNDIRQLSEDTSIESVAQAIQENLPAE